MVYYMYIDVVLPAHVTIISDHRPLFELANEKQILVNYQHTYA